MGGGLRTQLRKQLCIVVPSPPAPRHPPALRTTPRVQGQECDIILFSAVRTHGLGFVQDERRLNVAITRAKVLVEPKYNPYLAPIYPRLNVAITRIKVRLRPACTSPFMHIQAPQPLLRLPRRCAGAPENGGWVVARHILISTPTFPHAATAAARQYALVVLGDSRNLKKSDRWRSLIEHVVSSGAGSFPFFTDLVGRAEHKAVVDEKRLEDMRVSAHFFRDTVWGGRVLLKDAFVRSIVKVSWG